MKEEITINVRTQLLHIAIVDDAPENVCEATLVVQVEGQEPEVVCELFTYRERSEVET